MSGTGAVLPREVVDSRDVDPDPRIVVDVLDGIDGAFPREPAGHGRVTVLIMMVIAKMRAVVLDCPNPRLLADFYRALVGGEITYADDDWVNLRDGGNVLLSFQRAPDYQAPDWPGAEHGQQFHIDVTVDDVDEAEQRVLAIGARRTELQPGIAEASNWRVYLDPVGHPFCLCWD